jgi:hypothetical protein
LGFRRGKETGEAIGVLRILKQTLEIDIAGLLHRLAEGI